MFVQLPLLFLELLLLLPPHLFLSSGGLLSGSSQILDGFFLPRLAFSLFTLQGRYDFPQCVVGGTQLPVPIIAKSTPVFLRCA